MSATVPPAPDATAVPRRWVGERRPRVEDPALLTGRGRFVADLAIPGMLHAAFVRSTVPHARIVAVDVTAAKAVPGVHAVYTVDDLPTGPITDRLPFPEAVKTPRWALAKDKVRFVGEPVVMVVADDRYVAEDAAELVTLELDPLPPVTDATDRSGPALHDDTPDNTYYRSSRGYDELDEVFARAPIVHRRTVHTNRYLAAPMEGRGIVADHDPTTGELTCWIATQSPHGARATLAGALGIPEHRIRVIAPEVGGAFGMKNVVYPEDLSVVMASRLLGRPVRWEEDRYEHLVGGAHGKEQHVDLEIALDEDGTILALRGRFTGDAGAYSFSQVGGLIEVALAATTCPGPYAVGAYGYEITGALTTKAPIAAVRGVGVTAGQTARELLLDEVARAHGLDRVELRRRNLIPPDAFPYTTASGQVYDSGSYERCLDLALEHLDLDAVEEARAAARARGRLLGWAVSPFVEMTAYGYRGGLQAGVPLRSHDNATVTVLPGGQVEVKVGTSAHGQGHRTTFAQVVADELGVHPDDVTVVEGDTARVPFGMGTFGSRSAVFGSGAVTRAAAKVRDRLARVAAHLLEVDADDVELRDGTFTVAGDPSTALPLPQVAAAAYFDPGVRQVIADPLPQDTAFYDAPTTYSSGCMAAVVEVDPETGTVDLVRAVAVDDCGTIINPMIVDGQLRGGVAQGIGAALHEGFAYDPDGQPLSATYLDYRLPRATDVPDLEIDHVVTPSPFTVGGIKGMAESGAIAMPAAIICAVADAIAETGATIGRLPLSAAAVWEALDAAPREDAT